MSMGFKGFIVLELFIDVCTYNVKEKRPEKEHRSKGQIDARGAKAEGRG